MALELVTNLADVDALLAATRARGVATRVSTRENMFKDPTFFIKDTVTNQLYAFSNRGTYFEWNWGTSPTKPARIQDIELVLRSMLTLAFTEAALRWPGLPFSYIYNQHCPSVEELSNNRTDLVVADAITNTVNALRPGTAMRVNPPVVMGFRLSDRVKHYAEVYSHSVVLRIEDRTFDFTRGTPPGVVIG